MRTTVLLVDYIEAYQWALAVHLKRHQFITIGQSQSGNEINHLYKELQPDLCIIRTQTFNTYDGLAITRDLLKKFPEARVIGISQFFDNSFRDDLIKMGASGYLCATTHLKTVVQALHIIRTGQNFFCNRKQ